MRFPIPSRQFDKAVADGHIGSVKFGHKKQSARLFNAADIEAWLDALSAGRMPRQTRFRRSKRGEITTRPVPARVPSANSKVGGLRFALEANVKEGDQVGDVVVSESSRSLAESSGTKRQPALKWPRIYLAADQTSDRTTFPRKEVR